MPFAAKRLRHLVRGGKFVLPRLRGWRTLEVVDPGEVMSLTLDKPKLDSIRNLFDLYMPVVSGWKVYDNSAEGIPRLIAKGKREQAEVVLDSERWSLVRRSTADG